MSLFKTRDIWSTSCDNDLFDLGCLKVANLGANKKKFNSIITGSYNGFLRIYNPSYTDSKGKLNDNNDSYKAHDLISETSFPSPIIQIETGRFVNTSNKQHIAVLMPKKLAIYEMIAYEDGNVEHGNQYSIKFIYEHVLQRTAFNMCKGAFGGVSSISSGEPHEYICVQSMDGMLSVFEHESFSLSCFLPKVLIPGPFKYIQKSDSFITVNSSWELESYKYQILATSASTLERKSNENTNVKQKKILPEFTYNLGEAAIDIEIVNYSNSSTCSILVLGERNLYCFSDTCAFKYMKKFDFNPSCFCAYPIISSNGGSSDPNSKVNFIVATHSKLLFVHEDVKVKWAAQVEQVPVQIAVAKLNDMNGMIVTLSEDGKLKCSYLGTEPAFLNPTLKEDASKPFNFETAEKEYRSLQAQIKSNIMNTGAVITTTNKGGLTISVEVPKQLDQITPLNRNKDTELKDPLDSIPSVTCSLSLKSMETVSNVKVNLSCCLPLVAVPDNFSFASIGSVPFDQDVCFYMKTNHIPSSLNVTVCASYSYSLNGAPRITETMFRLPLKLVMKSGQHSSMTKMEQNQDEQKSLSIDKKTQQSGLKKITIETNKPCANLTEIFPEFSSSYSQANGNTLVAQFFGHPNSSISIQGAKSGSNKYRLQSDTLESLWLVTQEFVIRLKAHFKKQSQEIEIYFKETLPIEDFKLTIDKHLELRQNADHSKEMLEQCCIQFRAIQKRLLTKFKDKSPTSLDNMDALLEATHRQIVSVADSYLSTQKELALMTNKLNCIGSLYVLLVSLVFRLDEESLQIFESVLTNRIGDKQDLGWEEIVNASISNLLKTALSKSSKENTPATQQNALKLPIDSSKIEKQLKSLISKLENGATIVTSVYHSKNSIDNNSTYEKASNHQSSNKSLSKSVDKQSDIFGKTEKSSEQPPIKKAPVAAKSKFTMGEDYDDEPVVATQKKETINESKKTFGSNRLPTFEELMASEELKNKTPFNFDDSD